MKFCSHVSQLAIGKTGLLLTGSCNQKIFLKLHTYADHINSHSSLKSAFVSGAPSRTWNFYDLSYTFRAPDKREYCRKFKDNFFFLNENICCDPSLEPSRWSQNMFLRRNTPELSLLPLLIWSIDINLSIKWCF